VQGYRQIRKFIFNMFDGESKMNQRQVMPAEQATLNQNNQQAGTNAAENGTNVAVMAHALVISTDQQLARTQINKQNNQTSVKTLGRHLQKRYNV